MAQMPSTSPNGHGALQEAINRSEPACTREGQNEYGVAVFQRIAHQHRGDGEKPESGEQIQLIHPYFCRFDAAASRGYLGRS